jgi:hypothetical protein
VLCCFSANVDYSTQYRFALIFLSLPYSLTLQKAAAGPLELLTRQNLMSLSLL